MAKGIESYGRSSAESSKALEQRQVGQASLLLEKIMEDLSPQDFTFDEIRDGFNVSGGRGPSLGHTVRVRFSLPHLEILVQRGLIAKGGEESHYYVTEQGVAAYESESEAEEDG